MRILLIVGDEDFSVVLKHALRSIDDNINIDRAKTFCEAEEMLRHTKYRMALCDGDLKPICRSSQRAAQRIKAMQPEIKVLYMVSKDSDAEAFASADKVISKPFTSSDIIKETADALAQN